MQPRVSYEKPRGCGYRKEGGLYLVSDAAAMGCGLLPMPLDVCPTCSAGIKPSRGWTWVDAEKLFDGRNCTAGTDYCRSCPLPQLGRVGLLWIGEKFYARPEDFNKEAETQGISRRISTVPLDFVIGESWVLLAHRKCIEQADGEYTPGIFKIFLPDRIEKVVAGEISDDEHAALDKRNITPVIVKRLDACGTPEFEFTGIHTIEVTSE